MIWENRTWYDVLGYKYNNYNEFKNYILEKNIDSNEKLHKLLKKNKLKKFPYYPEEYYRLSGWNGWIINDNIDLLF